MSKDKEKYAQRENIEIDQREREEAMYRHVNRESILRHQDDINRASRILS